MSQTQSTASRRLAQDIAAQTPRDVRLSTQRSKHLEQYIHGLLPSNIRASVDVVVSEQVESAAVLPANERDLLESEQTDYSKKEARELINSTEADYIVFITGRAAPLDAIPLDDQLTADAAFQFGLALHETLHIIKTAFSGISEIIEAEVDSQYKETVHELINTTEDGAIEHEASTGEEFGNRPAVRLKLVNDVFTDHIDAEGSPSVRIFSLGDAINKALFDKLIYDSGVTDSLRDESDSRTRFSHEDEFTAFQEIYPEIESLAADILSTRSDHSDRLFDDDKEASIKRAKRTVQFWNDVLKPIKEESGKTEQQDQQGQQGQQGQSDQNDRSDQPSQSQQGGTQSGDEQTTTDPGQSEAGPSDLSESSGSDSVSQPESGAEDNSGQSGVSEDETTNSDGPSDSSQQAEKSPQNPLDSVDPQNISFEVSDGNRPLQDLQEHPDIGDEPDPDTVDFEPAQQPTPESQSQSQSQSSPESPPDEHEETPASSGQQEAPEDSLSEDELNEGQQNSGELESTHEAIEDGEAHAEPEDDSGSSIGGSESNQTPMSESTSSMGQSTFGDFGDQSHTDESGPEGSEKEPGEAERAESSSGDGESSSGGGESEGDVDGEPGEQPTNEQPAEQIPHSGDGENSAPTSETGGDSEAADGVDGANTADDSDPGSDGEPDVPEPAHDSSELSPDDLASDRDLAQRTVEESTVDERALEEDLNALAEAHTAERDSEDGSTQTSGSSVGGEESLGELSIMPTPRSQPPADCDWAAVEDNASLVGDTLAKQLRLDRRTGVRNGLCSGTTVNAKTAHRLAVKDPRVFSQEIAGREKEYFIVFVLDRSYSMSDENLDRETGSKIDVATQALARFAVACEDLEIDVAITDFYGGDARLIKPPSVETSYVQDSILSTETSGGTPLAESLSLARKLADRDSKESIIITLTDGIPANVDEVIDEIKQSYSPICSLTVATDCNPDVPPADAERLDKEYDQSTIVYDAQDLDRRLDQFASLLGAY